VNVAPKGLGEFPKMGREWLLRQSPDIIVMTHEQDKPLKKTPGLRALKAVIEDRVCMLSQEESDRLLRLGPRVVWGMRAVVECINKMRPL
jgi:iron complex transport system substrate-binding protein